MNKQEYIKKYGSERYQEYLKRQKQRYQEKRDEILERQKQYHKQYYQEKRDKILERHKRYHQEHPEYNKQYYQENREELLERSKQYYQENREKISERQKQYHRQYQQTQYGRATNLLGGYRYMDRLKGYETDITSEWIVDNIFTSRCYYCGETDWMKLGTDRIDNTKGHTMDNCICACAQCNAERQDKMTVEEFKQYKQLYPVVCDIPKKPQFN